MRLRAPLAVAAAAALAIPLLATPAVAAPRVAAAAPVALEDLVTEPAVYAHLQEFQEIADANGGNRAMNTSGYEASAAYIEQQLQAAGYTTSRQTFGVAGAVEDSTLSVTGVTADFTPAAFISSPYTTAPGITAPLVQPVDAGRLGCVPEDWAGVAATGAIAVISRGTCAFGVKVLNAAAAGAAAVLVYNNADEPIGNGTLGDPNPAFVPAASIPLGQAQPILTALAAGPVTAQLHVSKSDAPTFNVIAETPTGRADNVVMLGAHLDGVEDGPGINDNASGSAALLETALQLIDAGPVNNKVRFAWWGAEEVGLVGSTHYVDDLVANDPAALDDIATYLNFDMVASPNYIIGVYDANESTYPAPVEVPEGSVQTEAIFTDYFDGIDQAWVDTEFSGRSDYQAFIENGVPASGLFTGADDVKTAEEVALFGGTAGITHDPNYHSPADDIANVNREALGIMSKAIAHATASLADDTFAVNGVATPGARPVVKITSPAVGTTVRGSLTASGTATDDYGLADDTVTLHLRPLNANGNCGGFQASQTVPVVDGTWTATWAAGVVADGKYCVTALTKDNAGQENAGGGTHLKSITLTDGLPKMTNLSTKAQCSANGIASVAVYAVNGEQRPVDVRLSTTFADQKFTSVAAGKASYAFLQTGAKSVSAGSATVAAYYWADGKGYHEVYTLPYSAVTCP
ncbi:MAG: M20/M25/M40 family metallo-hydrolase [Microbacteriaceae bacterium]